jgi:hypothetical protein
VGQRGLLDGCDRAVIARLNSLDFPKTCPLGQHSGGGVISQHRLLDALDAG